MKQRKASRVGCVQVSNGHPLKRNACCFSLILLSVLVIALQVKVFIIYPAITYPDVYDIHEHRVTFSPEMLSKHPLLIDWHNHHGLEDTEVRTCKLNTGDFTCIITKDRSYSTTNYSQGIMFYGTDVSLTDLPLPRQPQHVWTLMHEESPKNNIIFSFEGILKLFNYTSTFRRESNLPLATQYVRNVKQIESTQFMKSFQQKERWMESEKLAPIIFVQGDCGVPSDRDHLVQMLIKYIKIDSYGKCLHNKDLPKHLVDPISGMTHTDFLELVSKYKFAIAMENGICQDYITEKFWRPLGVGTIPIVLGSPSISDFSPTNHAIIDVNKYSSIRQLVSDIESISSDQKKYDSYRSFKHPGGVTNHYLRKTLEEREWEPDTDIQLNRDRTKPNFPELYTCRVCEMMHNIKHRGSKYQASFDHYGCPWPAEFLNENNLKIKVPFSDMWHAVWRQTGDRVNAFLHVSKGGRVKPSLEEMDKHFQDHVQ